MGVGLLCLLVLAMTVFLPASTAASSLSSAPFQRNAFGSSPSFFFVFVLSDQKNYNQKNNIKTPTNTNINNNNQ
jgi:uncharacterized membrane protein